MVVGHIPLPDHFRSGKRGAVEQLVFPELGLHVAKGGFGVGLKFVIQEFIERVIVHVYVHDDLRVRWYGSSK